MNNEEIRVMTLVRKAKPDKDSKSGDTTAVERYFTTDYFDVLISEKRELDVPLNLWINDSIGKYDNETAVQRYSLYFSSQIYDKYEKNKSELYRNDPFDKSIDYKFLSVIQVYISPEILRRLKNKRDTVWAGESRDALLDIFLDDLYDIVEKFREAYSEQNFIYRIYYALSAGDFAIVIKSQVPELSFGVASYIRSRLSEDTNKRWAVYKTYTLLAFEENINGWEKDAKRLLADYDGGKFILRGSYSWRYWEAQEGIRNIEGIDRLNGRYDISLELTEDEFGTLYPSITQTDQKDEEDSDKIGGKLEQLLPLIKNDYLSYINERYLMNGMEIAVNDKDIKSFVELEDNVAVQLDTLNREYIQKLYEKQGRLEDECESVCKEHKILRHYFSLIKRQIDFCRVLNEQSDTRIYAKGMETLLDTVLESLKKYNEKYNDENERYLSEQEFNQRGKLIIHYTQKAIYSINIYMEYVRNNNLQSLQTPNYNIESDMGMEKILIGYGEYLREFLRFYLSQNEEKMEISKEFLPIIVPNLNSVDIDVEALFPSSKAIEWEEGMVKGVEKMLIIINSPSMMELEDVPMAMAMLSHEIAHQFRYENRIDRNRVILELFSAECAETIVDKLIDHFQIEQKELITFPAVKTLLQGQLAQTIKKILMNKKYGYAVNMKAPLDYLKEELGENVLSFFFNFTHTSKLNKYLELFIQQTNELSDISISDIKAVEDLYDKANADEAWKIDDIGRTLENYVRELSVTSENSMGKCMLYMEDLMSQLTDDGQYKRNKNVEKCMCSLYKRLTRKWEKQNNEFKGKIQKDISICDYRMWSLAGRYLGLDVCSDKGSQVFRGNKTKFFDRLKQIKIVENDLQEAMGKIRMYREITSDIFMCCVMDLTPFAYLHIVVTNMWRRDLVENSYMIERIISVIFIIAVKNDIRKVQAIKKYHNICIEILKNIEKEINDVMSEANSEFRSIICGVSAALEGGNQENIYRNSLESFRRELVKKHTYKNDIFIKIDKLLLICNVLIREGESYIEQLYERSFLRKDYFKAYTVLNTFREKMSNNLGMAQLKCLNEDISKYLDRLYETGKVK